MTNFFPFLRQLKIADFAKRKRKCRGWAVAGMPALAEGLEERRLLSLGTTNASILADYSTSEIPAGSSFSITAHVSALDVQFLAPTGTVTFHNDTTDMDLPNAVSLQLVAGPAQTYAFSAVQINLFANSTYGFAAGDNNIVAIYSGDSNFSPNPPTGVQAGLDVFVTGSSLTPTVSLTTSPNPATVSTPVTLTASVSGSGATPSQTVTFLDNGSPIDPQNEPVTLNGGGIATLITSDLPVGDDSITAQYSGDSNYSPVTSAAQSETVNMATTVDDATITLDDPDVGMAVADGTQIPLTGIVEDPDGSPTLGTVNIMEGSTVVATVAPDAAGNFSAPVELLAAAATGGNVTIGAVWQNLQDSAEKAIAQTKVQPYLSAGASFNIPPVLLYNPPGSPEPYNAPVTVNLVNTGPADATFTLTSDKLGTGDVLLNGMSPPLTVMVPFAGLVKIQVTPVAVSSMANDLTFTIYAGAQAMPGQIIGTAQTTIASVIIPQDIYAADTPTAMLAPQSAVSGSAGAIADALQNDGYYRIPPDDGPNVAPTVENVMVTPDLSSLGSPAINLTVVGASAASGTALVNGQGSDYIETTGDISLTGETQTAPGSGGQLKLTVLLNGKPTTIQSNGFSVAAIPENVSFKAYQPTDIIHEPFHSTFTLQSDSGSDDDLQSGGLQIVRKYITPSNRIAVVPAFPEYGLGVFGTSYVNAQKSLGSGFLVTASELLTFDDERTGAQNIPVPNSGYLLAQKFASTTTTQGILTTVVEGSDVRIGPFTSAAGAGSFANVQIVTSSGAAPTDVIAAPVLGTVPPQPASREIRAADSVQTDSLSPASVGAAAMLGVSVQPPASIAAGSTFALTVQAEDSSGNLVSSFSGAITLRLNNYSGSPTASLGGNLSVNAVNGVASFPGLSLSSEGYYSITAQAGGLTEATSNAFTITPGAATGIVVVGPAAKVLTASPFQIQVAASDSNSNIDTTFNGPVTLTLSTNPTSATLGGTLTVNAVNGVATFPGLTIDKAGSGYVITASGDTFTATSAAFDVNDDQLAITAQPPATVATGQSFGLTIQPEDGSGAVDVNYGDAITLALDSSTAGPDTTIAGPVSLDTDNNGVATFSGLSITQPGVYEIVATAPDAASVTTQFFQVNPVATQLVITTQPPVAATAGAGFDVDVTAEDAYGSVDTSFTGNVTLAVASGGGSIGGTDTVAAVNGVATLTGITLSTPGNGYTLTASAGGLTSATTNTINVSPAGTASQLVFTTEPPATATAGAMVNLVVKAEDGFGTVDSSFTGAVTLSEPGDPTASLAVNAVAGVATFSNVPLVLAGTDKVLAADATGLSEGTSSAFTVNPAAATQLTLIGPSQNALAGSTFGFDVFAVDPYGNTDPNFTGAIRIALGANPGGSTLGGTLTANAVAGDASFTGLTLNNAGTGYTLSATAGGLTAGTSQPFDVTADQLVVTTDVTPAVGQLAPINVTVSAENGSGAVDSSFTGAVTAALVDQSTSGSGTTPTLGGTLTVNAVAGIATFSGLTVDTPGDYSLTFIATGVGQASSSGFAVTPRVATTTTLVISPLSVPFGQDLTVTATVASATGGTTGDGTVSLKSGANEFGTPSVASDGSAIFTATADGVGMRAITATFEGNRNFLPSVSSAVNVTFGLESTLTPTLGGAVFPQTAVAGQPFRASVPVVLANSGTALKGPVTVQLYVAGHPYLDGSQVQVGKLTRRISLAMGKSTVVRFNLHSLPASLMDGAYYFVAYITDTTGATNFGGTSNSLNVAAPVITLSATGGAVRPGVIRLNHPGSAAVTITDTGNVDAVGTLVIMLSPSSDGSTPVAGITLGGIHRAIHLRRGHPMVFQVPFKVTAALPAAGYQSYFSISLGNVVTTAVGGAFSAG